MNAPPLTRTNARPSWRRLFSPSLLGLCFVLCACMALMALAHWRWDESLRAVLAARDNLAQSRRFALLAQLNTERLLAGDNTLPRTLVIADLDRALTSARDLGQGRGSMAGFSIRVPVTGELAAATEGYLAALTQARAIMERQLGGFEAGGGALRLAQRTIDVRAVAVEAALLNHLAERRTLLRRHDMVTLAMVGLLGLLVMSYLYLAHRRRDAAVDALIDSESRLRAFAESLPEAAFMLDREGRCIEAYGSRQSLFAAPVETPAGRMLDDVFSAELSSRFLAVVRQALNSQATQSCEYELEIDGCAFMFESRVSPVPGTDRVVWLAWDVTARRRAEAHVRALSRLYNFLSQVNQTIVWAANENDLFQRICRVAIEFGGYRCAWLISGDPIGAEPVLRAGVGVPPTGRALADCVKSADGKALTYRVMQTGALLRLRVRDGDEVWTRLAKATGCSAYVGLPIRLDDQVVAVFAMLADDVDPDDPDEGRLFDEVALDLSFAMRRLRGEAERARAEQAERLLAAALRSTRDGVVVSGLDGVIVSVNKAFCDLSRHAEGEWIGRRLSDLLSIAGAPSAFEAISGALERDGFWQGEVAVRQFDGEHRDVWLSYGTVHDNDGRATHRVAVLTDITRIRRTEEMLQHLAQYDPLTDLPNRALMHARLTHALDVAARQHTQVAVMLLDLDNFKTINDGLGHAAGDEVLSEVALRLRSRLRAQDALGRQGGDEFMLVLEGLSHPNDAALVAQDMFDCLSPPVSLTTGQDIYVQASIGIAIYPENGDRAEDLMRDADAAMYQAKRTGRNAMRFYTDLLTVEATQRLSLETRLRRALENDAFELRYQPLVSVLDNRLIGAEVLVRLVDGGPTAPGPTEFIPIMENNGLIVQLGNRVREQACRQGRAWIDAGLQPGTLAVNLSVTEIRRGGLDQRIERMLEETGFPAAALELEMTESSLMDQGEHAQLFLAGLKRLGLRLSIDDFGTGYSSLSYLKRLPVDKLKIDRSFIRDIPADSGDMELASTIVALGHILGLTVLAEGVETQAQLDALRERGCDAYQGYLYSAPLTAAEFERCFLRQA
ncbi:MAG TPA: EAL domain-containing protein [Methyloversatilis sp.]